MAARYQAIHDDLLGQIEAGVYAPGSMLPTELELAQAYGVSRPTVRHALQLLSEAGLIDRRRHRGTVVLERKIEQGFATQIRSFAAEMRAADRVPRTTVVSCAVCPASSQVAEALGLDDGDPVLQLVRVRYADERPNVLVETYVPHVLYPGLETTDFEHASLYDTMRLMGAPVVQARRTLTVALADAGTATVLAVAPGSPTFMFRTFAINGEGQPAEYSLATYRGDTNSFEFVTQL